MDEAFKLRVVREVLAGATHKECAHRHGVSVRAVAKWLALYRQGGRPALGPGRRGRPARSGLNDGQRQRLGDLLAFYTPQDVGMEGTQWSGTLAAALVQRETGQRVSPALAMCWLMPVERGCAQPAFAQGLAGLQLCRHHELLALMLDGPLQTPPWSGLLERLRLVLQAHSVTLIVPATPRRSALLISSGLQGTGLLEGPYASYEVFSLDPFFDLPPNRMVAIEEVLDERAWLSSDFYRQFVVPHGVRYIIGADLRTEAGVECRMRITRSPAGHAFSVADRALCTLLLPHLRRSVALHSRLERLESERQAYAGAMEGLVTGTVMLNRACRVLSCNRVAQEVLDAADGLSLASGRLILHRPDEQRELERLLQSALAVADEQPPSGFGAMSVSRPSGKDKVGLVVRPLPHGREDDARPALAVFLGDPDRRAGGAYQLLRPLFGLSAAEAALAMLLADGLSLEEAAQRQCISRHTARSQLSAVFSKTGTSRQSTLVRLILRSLPAVA